MDVVFPLTPAEVDELDLERAKELFWQRVNRSGLYTEWA